jgi:hypothetical protein
VISVFIYEEVKGVRIFLPRLHLLPHSFLKYDVVISSFFQVIDIWFGKTTKSILKLYRCFQIDDLKITHIFPKIMCNPIVFFFLIIELNKFLILFCKSLSGPNKMIQSFQIISISYEIEIII